MKFIPAIRASGNLLALVIALTLLMLSPGLSMAVDVIDPNNPNNPNNGNNNPPPPPPPAAPPAAQPQPKPVASQPAPPKPDPAPRQPQQTRIEQPMLPFTSLLDRRPPAPVPDLRKLPELTLIPPLVRD